jgi:hypothetical protein
MLQNVHHQIDAPRASSLYCRWILIGDKQEARLVAVWIDSDMRCFATDFAPNSQNEIAQQEALGDPGGRPEFLIEAAVPQRNRKNI